MARDIDLLRRRRKSPSPVGRVDLPPSVAVRITRHRARDDESLPARRGPVPPARPVSHRRVRRSGPLYRANRRGRPLDRRAAPSTFPLATAPLPSTAARSGTLSPGLALAIAVVGFLTLFEQISQAQAS